MTRGRWLLLGALLGVLLLAGALVASRHEGSRVRYTAFENRGDKPGILITLVVRGGTVLSGELSICDQDHPSSPRKITSPLLDLVQHGSRIAFHVRLQAGNGIMDDRLAGDLHRVDDADIDFTWGDAQQTQASWPTCHLQANWTP